MLVCHVLGKHITISAATAAAVTTATSQFPDIYRHQQTNACVRDVSTILNPISMHIYNYNYVLISNLIIINKYFSFSSSSFYLPNRFFFVYIQFKIKYCK